MSSAPPIQPSSVAGPLAAALAGAVLADITGPAQTSVVRLTHNWRFEGTIARLADAIRTGDADSAVALLRSGAEDVSLAPLGLQYTLHLTLAYRQAAVSIEHALLLPGAVPLK